VRYQALGAGGSFLEIRQRWHRRPRTGGAIDLRIALLASYTIDPIVPYLGTFLDRAGLAAWPFVGPMNQIVQQCLDPSGWLAASKPDVLVIAPRFEEFWPAGHAEPDGGQRAMGGDLTTCLDAAVEAAARAGAYLLLALPAIPESRPTGVGDCNTSAGTFAASAAIREQLRFRAAGIPGVGVIDVEDVVRSVGTAQALTPALFRFAAVPYTEIVFAGIAERVARLMRARYAAPCRAVVIDAGLVTGTDGPVLLAFLRAARAGGLPVGLIGDVPAEELWAAVDAAVPELALDLLDGWAVDSRPLSERLAELAEEFAVDPAQLVLLTGDPEAADASAESPAVVLDGAADDWDVRLRRLGLLDRAPIIAGAVPRDAADSGPAISGSLGGASAVTSLDDFIASLNIRVECAPMRPEDVRPVEEMLERTQDFTLGLDVPTPRPVNPGEDPSSHIIIGRVRDRLGDYGSGAVLRLTFRDGSCHVDIFLVSCPVLGKGVEEVMLQKAVELAATNGCRQLVIAYRETGRNDLVVRFLRWAAAREWHYGQHGVVTVAAARASQPSAAVSVGERP
jgi:FkbH-like protein